MVDFREGFATVRAEGHKTLRHRVGVHSAQIIVGRSERAVEEMGLVSEPLLEKV